MLTVTKVKTSSKCSALMAPLLSMHGAHASVYSLFLPPLPHMRPTHMQSREHDYMVHVWSYCEEQAGEGGQDKRRRRDCNENAIICSQTDIILLWRKCDAAAQRQPSASSPYGFDWPQSLVKRFHWNTESELQRDCPWCLHIEAVHPLLWQRIRKCIGETHQGGG